MTDEYKNFLNWCEEKWEHDYKMQKLLSKLTSDDISFLKDQYETCLKAEREKIAEDVANKMDYMGSCLNEKNIILGVITGKRETLDSLCSTCKSESCVSNGTAISKADYETRLKADMVAMLEEIQLEIEELDPFGDEWSDSLDACNDIIQQKIASLKEIQNERN